MRGIDFIFIIIRSYFGKEQYMTDLFEMEFVALLSRNLVEFVEVLSAREGWYVRINGFQWLRSRKKEPHRFDNLEHTLHYLRDLGCTRVSVDLTFWSEEKAT